MILSLSLSLQSSESEARDLWVGAKRERERGDRENQTTLGRDPPDHPDNDFGWVGGWVEYPKIWNGVTRKNTNYCSTFWTSFGEWGPEQPCSIPLWCVIRVVRFDN